MTTAARPSFDLDALVRPIDPALPSGPSLRRDELYDRIKEARREDEAGLSQGVWQKPLKKADWDEVERLCLQTLESRTKDLRLAAWLTEAWLAKHGPEGAEAGLRLVESLCARFWDSVHPGLIGEDEAEGLEGRLAPLRWLDNHGTLRLKSVPLTRPETREPTIYTWLDWESASLLERTPPKKPPPPETVTTAKFMSSVLLTPAAFYVRLDRQLLRLSEAVEEVERLVDLRAGRSTALFNQFREVLGLIREFVSRALDQKADEDPAEDEVGVEAGEGGRVEGSGGPGVRWGPIRNRAEAYQRLQEAADYLLRAEPHSPTPHLVKRAVSWGHLTFTDLIRELVNDPRDLAAIYALLGIERPGKSG